MKIKLTVLFLILGLLINGAIQETAIAQNQPSQINVKDSLSLSQILSQTLTSYPTIAKAEEAIRMAEAEIGLAKSGYYPNVNANGTYTRISPVPELTIPEFGHFKFVPNNNYDASISIYETIYDFEKTALAVRMKESDKELTENNLALVKQKLTQLVSVTYYSLVYLQEAIRIKDTQIATLQKHLDFIILKEKTGSATQFEILSTQVRLSSAENQKVDLETSRQKQQSIMNTLLGLPVITELKVREDFVNSQSGISSDSLINYALNNRFEMVIARLKEDHARIQLRSAKVMNYPTLSLFVSGGVKNGYIPDIDKLTPNIASGLSLDVPLFDATRKKNRLRLANSNINIAQSNIDLTSRDISAEVHQNQTSLLASQKKIDQGKMQVKQAEEAFNLASVSYKTGAITNLDLLDSETVMEESRLNLLRAKIEYAINLVNLNISLGKSIQ